MQHDRVVLLLEEIAFRLSAGVLEKSQYLDQLYKGTIWATSDYRAQPGGRHASGFTKPTAVHGDLPTQTAAREGQVSKQESGGGVFQHLQKRIAAKKENDILTGGKI